MYSKSIRSNNAKSADNRREEIPVQLFSDSFSADAFMKNDRFDPPPRENMRAEEEDAKKDFEKTDAEKSEEKEAREAYSPQPIRPAKKRGLSFEIDDLLLIGLLLLFLSDTEKKEDMVIPILLGALLLF